MNYKNKKFKGLRKYYLSLKYKIIAPPTNHNALKKPHIILVPILSNFEGSYFPFVLSPNDLTNAISPNPLAKNLFNTIPRKPIIVAPIPNMTWVSKIFSILNLNQSNYIKFAQMCFASQTIKEKEGGIYL